MPAGNNFTEEQRQLTLLALARLAVDRPEFGERVERIAKDYLEGALLFAEYKRIRALEHSMRSMRRTR